MRNTDVVRQDARATVVVKAVAVADPAHDPETDGDVLALEAEAEDVRTPVIAEAERRVAAEAADARDRAATDDHAATADHEAVVDRVNNLSDYKHTKWPSCFVNDWYRMRVSVFTTALNRLLTHFIMCMIFS